MKISVIIPVYNVEKYLNQCIDSIIGQTYQDLEIILINDGSTDKSGSICDAYAQRDKRIKVIHKQNEGQASARNHGLSVATGDYISFIDSDDWIEPHMYSSAMQHFAVTPQLALVRYGVCRFWEGGHEFMETPNDVPENILKGEDLIASYGTGGCNGIMCSSIYRSDIFKDSGLSYPEGIIHEDEALSLAISCFLSQGVGYEVRIEQEVMYHYRVVKGSTTSKLEYRHLDGICKGIDFVRQYTNEYPQSAQKLINRQIARMLRLYIPEWIMAGIGKHIIEQKTKHLRKFILQNIDNLSITERLFYSFPYFYTRGSVILQKLT